MKQICWKKIMTIITIAILATGLVGCYSQSAELEASQVADTGEKEVGTIKIDENLPASGDDTPVVAEEEASRAPDESPAELELNLVDGVSRYETGTIGLAKAFEIALGHLGFRLEEIDLADYKFELEHGVYEIEIIVDGIEYEVDINATNGNLIKVEEEYEKNWKGNDRSWEQFISLEEAIEIALEYFGLKDVTFTSYEFELEDGEYELEFFVNGIKYEVDIMAQSGEIR